MNSQINRLAEPWFAFMSVNFVQIMTLFAVVALISRLYRRSSPSFLYALWGILFIKAVIPPDISIPVFTTPEQVTYYMGIVGESVQNFTAPVRSIHNPLTVNGILMILWAAGVAALFLRLNHHELRGILGKRIALRRPVSVHAVGELTVPFTTGLLRKLLFRIKSTAPAASVLRKSSPMKPRISGATTLLPPFFRL